MAEAESVLGWEPHLDDLMSDPIIHLVMRRDRLSGTAVWEAIKTARAHLAASSREKLLEKI